MSTTGRPTVAVHTPINWIIEWSYDAERDILGRAGVDLAVPSDEADAGRVIVDADVVIVSGPFGADKIGTPRRCVGIIAYSIGMDSIDQVAATAAGIPVTNCPFCVEEVSDHALALLLAVERRILPLTEAAHAGTWDVDHIAAPIRRLKGLTVGIIGTGRIGRLVGRKVRGFGMRSIGNDPYLSADPDPELPLRSLDEVLRESDIVVVCASLTDTSRGLLNAAAFAKVKPGVTLVNIARGPIIVEEALAEALRDGRVAQAGLDVRATEPPDPADDPLAGCPNLIITPHMAGAGREARDDLHVIAANTSIDLLRAAGRLS